MGRVKDYVIWHEEKFGAPPTDMSASSEYLADTERAFRVLRDRLKASLDTTPSSEFDFDMFISHASEDKDAFVGPLVAELKKQRMRVWYDETELKIGNSLRRKIDTGVAKSRFGVVVLSPRFFAKKWTQHELDGIFERDIGSEQYMLPIWHNLTYDELKKLSPTLSDRLAIDSSKFSIAEIAEKLAKVVHRT